MHSTAETEELLKCIDHDKLQVTSLLGAAIDGSWIGYTNAMGLKYHEPNTPESRQLVTPRNLRHALKTLPETETVAALYFLTGYNRDVLYPQVLWGMTHQTAVEDYAMERMNACFSTPRSHMKPGHKTCVGQLYGQIFNQKKQQLQLAVLPKNTKLAVGRYGETADHNWKRPKQMYFVHTILSRIGTSETVDTCMVRRNKYD